VTICAGDPRCGSHSRYEATAQIQTFVGTAMRIALARAASASRYHAASHRESGMAYLWTKTFHLVFVIAWMATVFYLPRLLMNVSEAGSDAAVRSRLLLMTRRLYRFGHHMFGIATILGGVLWFYFGIQGGWLHAKLTLVAALLAYFIYCGRCLRRAEAGESLRSARWWRWFNEAPLLALIAIVFLVLAKPF
jgi:putative membrane protein